MKEKRKGAPPNLIQELMPILIGALIGIAIAVGILEFEIFRMLPF